MGMIEAAELTQQMGKTGAQKQETTAGLVVDILVDATKQGLKGAANGLIGQPEFTMEKPESMPVIIKQEQATTRSTTESMPAPVDARVSQLKRVDRMRSQARLAQIRQELKKA